MPHFRFSSGRAFLALALGLGSTLPGPESTPPRVLMVVVKSDNTLAMVDPATFQVIARVPVAPDPHEVVASADGNFAYVSHSGGGSDNRISVVDLVNRKTLPTIDLGPLRGPHGLAFAGSKVW